LVVEVRYRLKTSVSRYESEITYPDILGVLYKFE
jgi:hypothetical protein